ncbi:MAG: DUF6495 family protein [Brumimicrobium sp.]
MPKYRSLTTQELKELESEFVDFLVVNGITANQWVKVKKGSKETAEKIIEQFSDVVWEGVLRKIMFLEHRTPQNLRTFQCLDDKIILMGINIEDPSIDITKNDDFKALQQKLPKAKTYTTEKKYNNKREEEIFRLIQDGCYKSDGKMFKAIALSLAEEE